MKKRVSNCHIDQYIHMGSYNPMALYKDSDRC